MCVCEAVGGVWCVCVCLRRWEGLGVCVCVCVRRWEGFGVCVCVCVCV